MKIKFIVLFLTPYFLQEKLVLKDFNIMDEAKGAQKPITKPFTVNVTNHFLAIRLSWAGKGTTRIPTRGVYGPLISAISIVSGSFLNISESINDHYSSFF